MILETWAEADAEADADTDADADADAVVPDGGWLCWEGVDVGAEFSAIGLFGINRPCRTGRAGPGTLAEVCLVGDFFGEIIVT